MSIVVKKIKKKEYAYFAYRSGDKIVQKYLGPLSNPETQAKVKALETEKKIPDRFCYLFWDADPSTIDIRKNARYIIERVLEMGDLDSFFWIQRLYPTKLIIDTCETSRKITLKSKNFWRIWFHHAS